MQLNQRFRQMIKSESETKILTKNWRISYWLPEQGEPDWRMLDEIKMRMAVMHAMIHLAYKVPATDIAKWLEANKLTEHLSKVERFLLTKMGNNLNQNEREYLIAYVESLWTLMWATKMVDNLSADQLCTEQMAQMLPNLYEAKEISKIHDIAELRGVGERYEMLDYYQRVHWFCLDELKSGRTLPPPLSEQVVTSRYKSLLWLYDQKQNWDHVQFV